MGDIYIGILDRSAERLPGLEAELELSHSYADPASFTDEDLQRRWLHYQGQATRRDVVPIALDKIKRIRDRAAFELQQRGRDL